MSKNLLKEVSSMTGLSDEVVYNELRSIFVERGIDLSSMTLDDLRSAMAIYVRQILSDCVEK